MDHVTKLSVIYNSCSTPLQQQILSMNIGEKAQKEEFRFQELLQIICILANLPNHQELALQQLYAGIKQASTDSVTVFLEKIRNLAEDNYGLASTWTVNQTSTVIQKVVGGLRNKDLAQLTSSIVITLPFDFNNFRDIITQFELRLPSPPPAVHAISAIRCYKCSGPHLAWDCSTVSCFKCAGTHKTVMCKVPKNKLHCSRCNMSNHTTEGHRDLPGRSAQRVETGEEVGVFTCYNTGTSFVDGAVSINDGGKNFFVNSKLLVDTGVLMPLSLIHI